MSTTPTTTNPLHGLSALIYDCEIRRVIDTSKSETKYDYVTSWKDFKGMGVSIVCAYDCLHNRYRVFDEHNKDAFTSLLISRNVLVGYNNIPFDNELLFGSSWLRDMVKLEKKTVQLYQLVRFKSYDILREAAASQGGDSTYGSAYRGLTLDAVYRKNIGEDGAKTDKGSSAPILYQEGRFAELTDYCLNDVAMTADLFARIIRTGKLLHPTGDVVLDLKKPEGLYKQVGLFDRDGSVGGGDDVVPGTKRDLEGISDLLDKIDMDDI